MTIGKISIEFHKITTLGRPWEDIGDAGEVLGIALGGHWRVLGESSGVLGDPRGLLGALVNPTTKMSENHMLEHPIMMVKPIKH